MNDLDAEAFSAALREQRDLRRSPIVFMGIYDKQADSVQSFSRADGLKRSRNFLRVIGRQRDSAALFHVPIEGGSEGVKDQRRADRKAGDFRLRERAGLYA